MPGHPFHESPTAAPAASPAETAAYIKDLIESLRNMAEHQGQVRLAHLLGMAKQEAETLTRRLTSART